MGNMCSGEKSEREPTNRIQFKLGNLKIAPTDESFDEFGKVVREKHFKFNEEIKKSLKKYGLYKFNHSIADLRGTEALPVKLATNEEVVFYGQMLGSKLHGKGHMQISNGDFYVCPFYEGQARGMGAIYFANGDFFFGRLVLGEMEEGKIIYKNGTVYQGSFLHNKRNGHGTFNYSNGDIFEGTWQEDKQNGPGKLIIHGRWEDGKQVAKGENQDGQIRASDNFADLETDKFSNPMKNSNNRS